MLILKKGMKCVKWLGPEMVLDSWEPGHFLGTPQLTVRSLGVDPSGSQADVGHIEAVDVVSPLWTHVVLKGLEVELRIPKNMVEPLDLASLGGPGISVNRCAS